jgi:hypothetical protein
VAASVAAARQAIRQETDGRTVRTDDALNRALLRLHWPRQQPNTAMHVLNTFTHIVNTYISAIPIPASGRHPISSIRTIQLTPTPRPSAQQSALRS